MSDNETSSSSIKILPPLAKKRKIQWDLETAGDSEDDDFNNIKETNSAPDSHYDINIPMSNKPSGNPPIGTTMQIKPMINKPTDNKPMYNEPSENKPSTITTTQIKPTTNKPTDKKPTKTELTPSKSTGKHLRRRSKPISLLQTSYLYYSKPKSLIKPIEYSDTDDDIDIDCKRMDKPEDIKQRSLAQIDSSKHEGDDNQGHVKKHTEDESQHTWSFKIVIEVVIVDYLLFRLYYWCKMNSVSFYLTLIIV